MKFIHIASFGGNVGDIINHEGFYESLDICRDEIKQIEIRKFYKNSRELCFDKQLLEQINNSDGLILGGGGFFDVRWDYSNTGTTINLSNSFIDGIKVPVVVNAMGVHIDYNNTEAISRFVLFVKRISADRKWLISVRNDGSINRLKSVYTGLSDSILSVPDNGFLCNHKCNMIKQKKIVGLSITNDLFSKEYNGNITTEKFNNIMISICNYILSKGDDILFFLHAPQDLHVLHTLYSGLGDTPFRYRIKVSHFDMYTKDGAQKIDELYAACKYIIAMRFHGNVLGIKNTIPIIGLAGHEQIEGLYTDLDLMDNCVVVREGFDNRLKNLIDTIGDEESSVIEREQMVMKRILKEYNYYIDRVKDHLNM